MMKTRIVEFTDGGPGVGVSNRDTHFRHAERFMICNADYFIRHHLANDDSSQNDVERMQSYVGDAICDGAALEWEYKTPLEGLTEESLREMISEDLERFEVQRMEYNAYKVCEKLGIE